MKCPVCKGDKYIQEFDSRGVRKYQCRTCGGTGDVDKIREEFEKYIGKGMYKRDNFGNYDNPDVHNISVDFNNWFKSRDEEIKKLKDLTEDLLLTLVKYGIKQSEDVIEALKEIT